MRHNSVQPDHSSLRWSSTFGATLRKGGAIFLFVPLSQALLTGQLLKPSTV